MNIEREVERILNIIEDLKEPINQKDLVQGNMHNPIHVTKKSCHICYVVDGFEHRNACSFSGRFKAK